MCKMKFQRRKSSDTSDECSLYDGGISSVSSIDEYNDPQAEARIAANMQLHEFSVNNTNLDRLLQDEEWVEEMMSLAPFCLQILKNCHALTTKLKTMTVSQAKEIKPLEKLEEIIRVAKMMTPRVDDLIYSMYSPLDHHLLEVKSKRLIQIVNQLVVVTRNVLRLGDFEAFVNVCLADLDRLLNEIRGYAESIERSSRNREDLSYVNTNFQHDCEAAI
ncbi:DgyrCDS12161 [Dimorphilus gyrociliatus]|uniref:Transmembrane protein 98 n=1 Tax=Dimorphilus gyrociliatus TaxID=2664684 RepID=A0A7I8W6P4_9ANNE|nr:DgyrCDS12161 [Dimorphilus gyrociliatus]